MEKEGKKKAVINEDDLANTNTISAGTPTRNKYVSLPVA